MLRKRVRGQKGGSERRGKEEKIRVEEKKEEKEEREGRVYSENGKTILESGASSKYIVYTKHRTVGLHRKAWMDRILDRQPIAPDN